MDWKIVLTVLLTAMLIFSVFAGCSQQQDAAVEEVRRMLEKLPSVEEFQSMEDAARLEGYNAVQAAYDAYMALSENQQEQLEGAREIFEALFGYFNAQIMPLA